MYPDHGNPSRLGLLYHGRSASSPTRAFSVPDRYQYVAQPEQPLPDGIVSVLGRSAGVSRSFGLFDGRGGIQERPELTPGERFGEVLLETCAMKGKYRPQPPMAAECREGGDAVGTLGQTREKHKPPTGMVRLDARHRLDQLALDTTDLAHGHAIGPVTGDADVDRLLRGAACSGFHCLNLFKPPSRMVKLWKA
jgi:hypothetical protein